MKRLRIGTRISQIILTEVEYFSEHKLESYRQKDRSEGIILTVVYDNLSSKDKFRYNYENFVGGLEFFWEKYDFKPYPPNTYLSEDIRFLKSTISHYYDNFHKEYNQLKKMNLDQYLLKLENIYQQTPSDQEVKRKMMREYIVEYMLKFPNRNDYILFCIAPRNEFIAKGMYLFGILPTLFVRLN